MLALLSVTLIACGSQPAADTGIYGITLTNQGGRFSEPSPLPGSFGESDLIPDLSEAVRIKALSGEHAGTIVASLRSDGHGIFRVPLPPGTYLVWGVAESGDAQAVTVHEGEFARVQVRTGYRF
jgi:hypothetical protein